MTPHLSAQLGDVAVSQRGERTGGDGEGVVQLAGLVTLGEQSVAIIPPSACAAAW